MESFFINVTIFMSLISNFCIQIWKTPIPSPVSFIFDHDNMDMAARTVGHGSRTRIGSSGVKCLMKFVLRPLIQIGYDFIFFGNMRWNFIYLRTGKWGQPIGEYTVRLKNYCLNFQLVDGDQVEKKEYLTNYMKIIGKYRIRSIARIPPKPSAT